MIGLKIQTKHKAEFVLIPEDKFALYDSYVKKNTEPLQSYVKITYDEGEITAIEPITLKPENIFENILLSIQGNMLPLSYNSYCCEDFYATY